MVSNGLDVVAVVRRIVSMDAPNAQLDELDWGVDAIDRVTRWFAARRATLQHERTLPRPLPPDPTPTPGDNSDGDNSNNAEPQPAGDPLPNLGPTPPPPSRREQELLNRRAAVLALAALFHAALEGGRISTDHADVLARVLNDLRATIRDRVLADEADLLDKAQHNTPESFARILRRAVDRAAQAEGVDQAAQLRAKCRLRQWDSDDGLHHVHLTLDSELATLLNGDLNAEIEAMYRRGDAKDLDHDQVALFALLNLTRSGKAAPRRSDPARVQYLMLADFETLFGGMHDRSILESAGGRTIHLEAARRLFCDAEITWAVTINGKVVSLVCEDELANRKQRRALRAMYRTCVHPDCDVPFDRCHIHHVVFRHRGGKTLMENLVPVCYRHHTMVHEGGWRLTMDADRTLHWQRPDGSTYADCRFIPLVDLDRMQTIGAGSEAGKPPPNGQAPRGGAPPGGAPPGTAPPESTTAGRAPSADADHDGELRLFADTSAAA